MVDSLNLSTEPSLQYNRTNNTEKSAGFHCCFDIRFQRKNNIILNTHIIANDGMNVTFYRNNNKESKITVLNKYNNFLSLSFLVCKFNKWYVLVTSRISALRPNYNTAPYSALAVFLTR